MLRRFSLGLTLVALGALFDTTAHATLSLTPTGLADGFTLTTFISGYGPVAYGPLAQGVLSNGDILTGSSSNRTIYVFKDVDNQTLANALVATPYVGTTGNPQYAMTTAGGQVYGAQLQGTAQYEKFNADGTKSPITGLTATDYAGIWGDPVNGHIIASANQGLIDINPLTGTFRVITSNPLVDGVTVSPDGTMLYGASAGNVLAVRISDGALLHTFSGNGRGPDGLGVISGGALTGYIVVNNNDGTVGLINPAVGTESIIASGGTRGDFVSPDTSNGTLFLSQEEQIARLGCGQGCVIGSVPEPSTFALLAVSLVILFGWNVKARCKVL